ncbi:S8 family serine peptidase [Haloarchaeobius iranensis]|uniref:Subtilisin n=1 Tax=Haloarchaeobius iranensis TaxID=996166 RepID=A0A1G9XH52_9EURY|nr:S8 family serine peptidase [Haloarchaeobius iranensis]SDM95585.1 subtilisin [Haloarchaeobius iranensis]
MVRDTNGVSRRKLLKGVGAGLAATTMAGEVVAGEGAQDVIVGVSDDHGLQTARERASSVRHEFDFDDIGQAVAGRFPAEAIDALQNNPHVRYVERDGEYHALAQTLPWGVDRVDADVLHGNGDTASGADIAILDTGIDSDHPDLADNIQGGKCFTDNCCGEAGGGGGPFGCDTNTNDCPNAWDDDNDHGTHCAGIADAVDNTEGVVGVSTQANLWAGKVLDGCGSGSLSAIAAGIEWAADQGFDVASMSLGASSGDQTLQDAVQYAANQGLLMVAAAGNDGPCSDCVGYPAAYPEVIAVSSTASDDSLSDFSSTGPEVELAAPGTDIYSTVPSGYATFSGTSMACPHVSGAAAQVMATGATASEARTILQDSAEDIGLAGNEQGYGLVDAENAVAAAGGGDGGDAAPSVSWANPAGGDTVSDTVSIQLSASDAEDSDDSLIVEWSVDGGPAQTASYDSTSGYYEASWDSTGVADGDHTLSATATDAAGNTSSSSITVTTDNSSSGSTAPAIDEFAVTNNSNGGWARFDVDWAVSDADGDLASVDLVLDQNGTADSASDSVSGSSASGSTRLQDKKGSGSYDVTLTVIDAAGNTTSQTKTVTA